MTGGYADTLNPCVGPSASYSYTQSELYWAVASSSGAASQPRASLYVNTADPGNVYNGAAIPDWPLVGNQPHLRACTTETVTLSTGATTTVGDNSDACAFQYGYNMGTQDAGWLKSAADAIDKALGSTKVPDTASSYPWWLDVETANTWQSDTTMNDADLQGMIAGLQAAGAGTVGVYSTSYQWGTIAGTTTATGSGSLYGIPNWVPGARGLSGAKSNCNLASFIGGKVTLTQWFSRPFDSDHAC